MKCIFIASADNSRRAVSSSKCRQRSGADYRTSWRGSWKTVACLCLQTYMCHRIMAMRLTLTLSLLFTLIFSAADRCYNCSTEREQCCSVTAACESHEDHECNPVVQHEHELQKKTTAINAKTISPLKHFFTAPDILVIVAALMRLPDVTAPPSHPCCSPFSFNNSILRC
jgi:hypothetical protein